MQRVMGNISCDQVKAKGQMMYFLVNASPKPLDIPTSKFIGAYVTWCRGYWATFCVTLTPIG